MDQRVGSSSKDIPGRAGPRAAVALTTQQRQTIDLSEQDQGLGLRPRPGEAARRAARQGAGDRRRDALPARSSSRCPGSRSTSRPSTDVSRRCSERLARRSGLSGRIRDFGYSLSEGRDAALDDAACSRTGSTWSKTCCAIWRRAVYPTSRRRWASAPRSGTTVPVSPARLWLQVCASVRSWPSRSHADRRRGGHQPNSSSRRLAGPRQG